MAGYLMKVETAICESPEYHRFTLPLLVRSHYASYSRAPREGKRNARTRTRAFLSTEEGKKKVRARAKYQVATGG